MILLLSATTIPAQAELLTSAWVPNSLLPQGQVQWIEDADGMRVQVLLHSRFMDRVVSSIIEKETRNWATNHPDAAGYIQGLNEARQHVQTQTKGRGRESLAIVFSLTPLPGHISWLTGDIKKNASGLLVLENPSLLTSRQPSRTYLVRNAVLVVEDSTGMERGSIMEKLRTRLGVDDGAVLTEWLNESR